MFAVSSVPKRAFADGIFLAFLGISARNDLLAPGRGRCAGTHGGLRFLSQRALFTPTPRAGSGALKVKPADLEGRGLR